MFTPPPKIFPSKDIILPSLNLQPPQLEILAIPLKPDSADSRCLAC